MLKRFDESGKQHKRQNLKDSLSYEKENEIAETNLTKNKGMMSQNTTDINSEHQKDQKISLTLKRNNESIKMANKKISCISINSDKTNLYIA